MKTLCIINGGGCAQIESASGILKAMDEMGISIDSYYGSSAGACVAALHASGISGRELEEIIKTNAEEELFRFSPRSFLKRISGMTKNASLYDASGLYRLLKEKITTKAFEKVRVTLCDAIAFKPYMVNATAETVMASAAIPEIFPPVKIGSEYFVDGGVKNMIPVPKINEIKKWRHIYILLCPGEKRRREDGFFNRNPLLAGIRAFLETMERETVQIYEAGWQDLPNVTVLQPDAVEQLNLLGWSKNYSVFEDAWNDARKKLEKGKEAK